jgi:hypothetical protein
MDWRALKVTLAQLIGRLLPWNLTDVFQPRDAESTAPNASVIHWPFLAGEASECWRRVVYLIGIVVPFFAQ